MITVRDIQYTRAESLIQTKPLHPTVISQNALPSCNFPPRHSLTWAWVCRTVSKLALAGCPFLRVFSSPLSSPEPTFV